MHELISCPNACAQYCPEFYLYSFVIVKVHSINLSIVHADYKLFIEFVIRLIYMFFIQIMISKLETPFNCKWIQ